MRRRDRGGVWVGGGDGMRLGEIQAALTFVILEGCRLLGWEGVCECVWGGQRKKSEQNICFLSVVFWGLIVCLPR